MTLRECNKIFVKALSIIFPLFWVKNERVTYNKTWNTKSETIKKRPSPFAWRWLNLIQSFWNFQNGSFSSFSCFFFFSFFSSFDFLRELGGVGGVGVGRVLGNDLVKEEEEKKNIEEERKRMGMMIGKHWYYYNDGDMVYWVYFK